MFTAFVRAALAVCALAVPAANAGDVAVFDEIPFFDFTDQYYLDNGVDPSLLFGRVQPGTPLAVADESPDPEFFRDVRVLLTIPGWDHSGDPVYLSVFGEFGPEAFTPNAAGAEARQIADEYPLYIFPKAGTPRFEPFDKRQNDIVPLNNGYFSGDPLGLWILIFVHYTDAAFDTPEGRAALAALAAENGYDLDGTPLVKTEGDILELEEDGFVEFLLRPLDNSHGGRWSVCPVLKDPRSGAIAPDSFLAAAVNELGQPAPSESELNQHFNCLQQTGDWCDGLTCPGDIAQPFGQLDLQDVAAFASGFTTQNPIADLNADGVLDLADIAFFVNAFAAGCP